MHDRAAILAMEDGRTECLNNPSCWHTCTVSCQSSIFCQSVIRENLIQHYLMYISGSIWMCEVVNGMQKGWRMCYFLFGRTQSIGKWSCPLVLTQSENWIMFKPSPVTAPLLCTSCISLGDQLWQNEPCCQAGWEEGHLYKTESEPLNCVINTFVLKQLCNEWHLWQEQHEMMIVVT